MGVPRHTYALGRRTPVSVLPGPIHPTKEVLV